MKIKKPHIIGMIVFFLIIVFGFIFLFKQDKNLYYFLLSVGFVIATLPFFVDLVLETSKEQEKGRMFLEFSRDLVESVKSGTPISKAIINLRNKDYGPLTFYIQKLANQISIGIPVSKAFDTFAKDVKSNIVTRSIMLIKEAEKAGGSIEDILENVSKSVRDIEKLKEERKAIIYGLTIEGYIIFFVFLIIMLIMQFKIIPLTSELSNLGESSIFSTNIDISSYNVTNQENNPNEEKEISVSTMMFVLLLVQSFFAGIIIGKLSEGSIKAGLKHSFILITTSLLIYLGANSFIG
ncbi:MAG: type II secretion system F family protein [Candidatus Pacearchaeota archaeon]